MPDDLEKMFAEVVVAVRQGQRARAKDLLSRLLRSDQNNAEYWVWMSAVVDAVNERQYCLQQALKLNPEHPAAQRGLILLGAFPADRVTPIPPPRRRWSVSADVQDDAVPKRGLVGLWQKLPPFFRARPVVLGFLAVTGFLCLGIGGCLVGALLQPRDNMPVGYHTAPPVTPNWDTNTPTPSQTFTPTPAVRTATPTLSGPTPLAAFFAVTYTPTARYVATPHNISEAYHSGLKSFDQAEYEKMLLNMQQASTEMPADADVAYYRAEALRNLTRYEEALDVYNQIVRDSPTFAPAYLGRARVQLAIKETIAVGNDLDMAIQVDPYFVEAYLQRAIYRLERGDLDGARQDLQAVEELNSEHIWLYWLSARISLQNGEYVQALAQAQNGFAADRTFLPVYLTLGQAYLANDQPLEARQYIYDYLVYEKEDPQAWLAVGLVNYQLASNYPVALDAFTKALEFNKNLADGYRYRGLTYLKLQDVKLAVNDLVKAVQLAPKHFQTGLDLGVALFAAERYTDAVNQLGAALKLAETDAQLASIYHWRAQIYQEAGNVPAAIKEWEALLSLPQGTVPVEWSRQARQSLMALTPTPEVTETPVPTTTITVTP